MQIRLSICVLVAWRALAAPQDVYRIEPVEGGFAASNPAQDLSVNFHHGRADFIHHADHFSLSLAGHAASPDASAHDNRLELRHGVETEWFVNNRDGIEQGFTIASRRGADQLEVALDVAGDYTPALEGTSIVLQKGARTMLHYAALRSWDADGRNLPSRAVVEGRRIRLLVDDSTAHYPVTVDPIVQEATLLPSDHAQNQVGRAVAISGDTIIAGATDDPTGVGAAYAFSRTSRAWNSGIKLPRVDGTPQDHFGFSVAIDGGIAAVGAYGALGNQGRAYVFTGSGGSWLKSAELPAPPPIGSNADVKFGASVALSGTTLIVGAPNSNNGAGAIYVYTSSGKGDWAPQQILTALDGLAGDNFGYSVAIDGDTAVVGAPGRNTFAGAVYVYKRSGSSWTFQGCACGGPGPGRFIGPLTPSDASQDRTFGYSLAVSGQTIIVGSPAQTSLFSDSSSGTGALQAYVFTYMDGLWAQQANLMPSDLLGKNGGLSVAFSRGIAAISAADAGLLGGPPAVYLFALQGPVWSQLARISSGEPGFGHWVALDGDTFVAGAFQSQNGQGEVDPYRLSNIALNSSPPGRNVTLSGTGCGPTGVFATPYTGLWTSCTAQWTSPDTATPGARYTFQNWADGSSPNLRTFSLAIDLVDTPYSYTANFLTEYQLTTQTVPTSGGAVAGSGWYTAGTSAGVSEVPNPGFLFTGFTGGLSGFTSPQTLLMDAAKTVTGNFTSTPPAVLNGIISAKSGTVSDRLWTISLTNGGPGVAYNAQVFLLTFVQTFGTACASLPVRLAPAVLPVSVGTLNPGSGALTQAEFDFSGCPANARFTVGIGYMSNGGSSGGMIQLVNQFQ